MAKKKKVGATSKLTARKTEAPMMLERPVEEPAVVAVPLVETVETVETVESTRLASSPQISREEIARLAFAKFAARGYVQGCAVEDWLAAEAELRARPRA